MRHCVINGFGQLTCFFYLDFFLSKLNIYSEGQGFILVYSIASRSTFERLEVFRKSMQRAKQGNPTFMLVGNKCDKTHEQEVTREEGAALAHQFGCEFLETSAKTAQNVEPLFMNLVRGGTPFKTDQKYRSNNTATTCQCEARKDI